MHNSKLLTHESWNWSPKSQNAELNKIGTWRPWATISSFLLTRDFLSSFENWVGLTFCALNLSWRRSQLYRNQSLICCANQWTSFYTTGTCHERVKGTRSWTLITCLKGSNCQRCSIKKLFLKISQCSQESTCVAVSFLVKFQV